MKNQLIFNKLIITLVLNFFAFNLTLLNSSPIENNDFEGNEIDKINIFIEGHEVDLKAAYLAYTRLNGGYYDSDFHAVLPCDVVLTEEQWKKAKDHIAQIIGPLPVLSEQKIVWENSSKDIDNLLLDAIIASPMFKNDLDCIAYQTETKAYFGPEDRNLVKSRESLINKVSLDAEDLENEEEAISKIGDTLRGTIIVEDILKVPSVIAEIINYADFKDTPVTFKNFWLQDRESGYVGIHAKMLFPLPAIEENDAKRHLLVEIQIHLKSIADGTVDSVKERTHLIYEYARLENFNHLKFSAASKLLYLTAMNEFLNSIAEK